jgi:hypothetical protein
MPSLLGRCGGGGGSITRYNGSYVGNAVNIAGNAGNANLTWDTHLDGDDVLNIGTSDQPVVTKTGNWAFTILVGCDFLTFGSAYRLSGNWTDPSPGGATIEPETWSPPASATLLEPRVMMTTAIWLPSGTPFAISIVNEDPAPRNFNLVQGLATFLGGS